ncbi:MAG TPA: hypothetical protein DDX10_03135, partial [Rikenellaceae bacterium]|nr:hypothetical protein [Rikenellaceae bacterium]
FSTKEYTPAAAPTASPTTTANPAAAPTPAGKPVLLWASHTGYGYEIGPSPITTADDLVFVPTDKGNIFVLNAADGTVAWTYRFSIALINYIRPIGNRTILVTSMDGKVGVIKY